MRKNRIRLTESDLHRIIKESVKGVLKESKRTPQAKRELEDALRNVVGILHAYIESDFEIFTKSELENLYEICSDMTRKINDSYDYGPYEGEPYNFGSY